jgi:hypothetical protein
MIKITALGVGVVGLAMVVGGCALKDKKTAQQVKEMPVDCATADGDLRMLEGEKKSTMQRIGSGVRMVVPAGIVVGVVTRTERTKYQVASGSYNQMIDAKIAQIKQACPDTVADNPPTKEASSSSSPPQQ